MSQLIKPVLHVIYEPDIILCCMNPVWILIVARHYYIKSSISIDRIKVKFGIPSTSSKRTELSFHQETFKSALKI